MARILVVDDDPLVLTTVQTMLMSGGHSAVLAGGAEDGIRQFRDHRFDLVICDLFLPTREKGIETVAAIRAMSATTPIISMSGGAPQGDGKALGAEPLRATADLGPIHMIGKPFRVQDLLAIVQKCLGSIAAWLAALQANLI